MGFHDTFIKPISHEKESVNNSYVAYDIFHKCHGAE